MVEKYVVPVDDNVNVGIKYDRTKKELIVGGYLIHHGAIEKIVRSYFRDELPRIHFTQRNKIRFRFYLSIGKFEEGLEHMREHGFHVERVIKHGRLMR